MMFEITALQQPEHPAWLNGKSALGHLRVQGGSGFDSRGRRKMNIFAWGNCLSGLSFILRYVLYKALSVTLSRFTYLFWV